MYLLIYLMAYLSHLLHFGYETCFFCGELKLNHCFAKVTHIKCCVSGAHCQCVHMNLKETQLFFYVVLI